MLRGRFQLSDEVRHMLSKFVPTQSGASRADLVVMHFFVRRGVVYVREFYPERQYDYIRERTEAMQCLLARTAAAHDLPDTELFVFINDDSRVRMKGRALATLPRMPLFEPSAPTDAHALLAPDFAFEAWPVKRVYNYSREAAVLAEAARRHGHPRDAAAWLHRKPQLFWRGGLGRAKRGREGYAALSAAHPDLVDVANWKTPRAPRHHHHHRNHSGVGSVGGSRQGGDAGARGAVDAVGAPSAGGGGSKNWTSRGDKCAYRHLLHLNGAANRAYSIALRFTMQCGATVFYSAEPQFKEWFHALMTPGVHYVNASSPQQVLALHKHYLRHADASRAIALAGDAFAARYLSYEAAQCFWATALREYTAAIVPPASAVARRSAAVLERLLARGEAAPLRLGELPVRFGGGAPGKTRRSVPVSVRC